MNADEQIINFCKTNLLNKRFSFDGKNRPGYHFRFSSFTIKKISEWCSDIYIYGNYISPESEKVSSLYCLIFEYRHWRLTGDVKKVMIVSKDGKINEDAAAWLGQSGNEYLTYNPEKDNYKIAEGGLLTKAAK